MKRFNTNSVALKASQRNKLAPALLLALSSFAITTAASAAELIENGGFESPVVPTNQFGGGWATYHGKDYAGGPDCPPVAPNCNDDTLVDGWYVFWTDLILEESSGVEGRLELQRGGTGGITAHHGDQKAELDSHHRLDSENNNVTIAQVLNTCPNSAYTLSYDWKSRTEDPLDNDVRVTLGLNLVNTHSSNNNWESETINFVSGASNQTLLSFISVGTESTHGMFLDDVSVTGLDGSNPENCPPPEGICEFGKPRSITLLYDGNDDSMHNQDGNEIIINPEIVAVYPNPALIKVSGHKRKGPAKLFEGTISIGGTFEITGERRRIPPRLNIEIIDPETNDVVQTVQFHSSCSQPLETLDEFGGITVWSATH
ncbi:MAG: hypothetical protein IMF09_08075 [Proteobacteria bacterium]|nr:hypothetical protein [Pseudomonadota bacterium]